MWIENSEGTLINLDVTQALQVQPSGDGAIVSVVAIHANGDQVVLIEFANASTPLLQSKAQNYLNEIKAGLANAGQLLTPKVSAPQSSGRIGLRSPG